MPPKGAKFFSQQFAKIILSPVRISEMLEALIDALSWGFELYETFTLKQGITFKLSNAGHILGSCFIPFTFPDANTKDYRVIFSGDLGCTDTPILPDPDPPENCDLLILESTYGDRLHPSRKGRTEALQKLLNRALADKGIVYIPAFALGRTQELLYDLERIGSKFPRPLPRGTYFWCGRGLGGGGSCNVQLRDKLTHPSIPSRQGRGG